MKRRNDTTPAFCLLPSAFCLRRGFTLIELLLVIAIITVLLGLSAGAYWRMARDFKEQGAAAQVDVLLRQVRNSAVTLSAPAYAEIDVENRRLTPYGCSVAGLWHFEDRDDYGHTTGARRNNAMMRGADLYKDGKIGKCARLLPNGYIDCGADPDFDCEDGGYLEAYIRLAMYEGDGYIFCKEGAYSLQIGRRGALVADVGAVHVTSPAHQIVPGRWTKVALAWDGNSTRILADDCIVASGKGARPPLNDRPLTIGRETGSFEGLVDEVRILTAVKGAPLELPKSYTLTHTAAPWSAIYFAPDGSLDMRYHAGPVSVMLEQDGRVRAVSVSMLGQTAREELVKLEKPKDGPPPMTPEERRRRVLEQNRQIKLIEAKKAAKAPAIDD